MKLFRIHFLIMLLLLISNTNTFAQDPDRATGTHNINQVGYFVSNIGQFYEWDGTFQRTMEFPINSGHICMYRQCIMIGVPVNVISAASGRYEEWDALPGYDAGMFEIAMSDDPSTWPDSGWPVQDEEGNYIILSQQDSYCVYCDSLNWRYYNNHEEDMLLNIRVHQSVYSWGIIGTEKFHILKFEIENTSDMELTEMYFNFYSDMDMGGISSGGEWLDDCVGFDKDRELVYFFDADKYSDEWDEENPFLTGVIFLKTPNDLGISDWHWIKASIDEVAVNSAFWDSVSYYLMKSDTMFFHNHPLLDVSNFFHLGDNPLNGTHWDDPITSHITDESGNLIGTDVVAYICNGPFDIPPGERAEIWVGVMVGDNEGDLLAVADKIWEYYEDDFNIAIIPMPEIEAKVGDCIVDLYWSNKLDVEYINPILAIPENDLEGYILYCTTDPTLSNWTVLDTIYMLYKEDSVITEQAYHFQDEAVYNGFRYFYNLSAYRISPAGKLEQSILLTDISSIDVRPNAVEAMPRTDAIVNKGDIDKIRVVPNPYVVSAQWDEARLGNSPFGEPIRNIAFTNLPTPCMIKIFTVDGDLVQTIKHTNSTGREEWNLLTFERRPIVSGIYFYHVESKSGEKIGRFALIR